MKVEENLLSSTSNPSPCCVLILQLRKGGKWGKIKIMSCIDVPMFFFAGPSLCVYRSKTSVLFFMTRALKMLIGGGVCFEVFFPGSIFGPLGSRSKTKGFCIPLFDDRV